MPAGAQHAGARLQFPSLAKAISIRRLGLAQAMVPFSGHEIRPSLRHFPSPLLFPLLSCLNFPVCRPLLSRFMTLARKSIHKLESVDICDDHFIGAPIIRRLVSARRNTTRTKMIPSQSVLELFFFRLNCGFAPFRVCFTIAQLI